MSYTVPTQRVTGTLITASIYNTDIIDNIAATGVGVVTSGGDLSYATGNHALTRLTIGASATKLQSTGGIPAWVAFKYATATLISRIGTNATSFVDTGLSVTLTPVGGVVHGVLTNLVLSGDTAHNAEYALSTDGVSASFIQTLNAVTCNISNYFVASGLTGGASHTFGITLKRTYGAAYVYAGSEGAVATLTVFEP